MHAIPTGAIGSPSEAWPGGAFHGRRQRAWLLAAGGMLASLLAVGGYARRRATAPPPLYATVSQETAATSHSAWLQAKAQAALESQRQYQQACLGHARTQGQRYADTAQWFIAMGGAPSP